MYHRINFRQLYFLCIVLCSLSYSYSTYASQNYVVKINNQLEIDLNYNTAPGDTLLLVLPSEYGLQTAEKNLSNILPKYKTEVWTGDLLESYFLENTAANLEKIPSKDIQILLDKLHKKTNKKIIILTSGRGAIPVLRALASWPAAATPDYLSGLILVHPKLFLKTPEPGLKAELMPSVAKTNQLIYLIQPTLSPFWWNKDVSMQGLQASGSDVFLRSLKNIRNRFYFRPDATTLENNYRKKYPNLILNAIRQLQKFPHKKRSVNKNYIAKNIVTSIKKQKQLSIYKGSPVPPPLKLKTLSGDFYDLKTNKGKVILLNFWASWCPPCVHEMPSMQQLEDHFKSVETDKFSVVAVNMAEDRKTINTFLQNKVSVNFDILLDSDGTALKQWKVFAFPTSFVIDKNGQIRYALYGGVDWMRPDIVKKIQTLISE